MYAGPRSMSRHRNFTITQNNYGSTDLLDGIECAYIAYSKEIAETGTPHLQGFICFENAKTKSAAIKLLPGCHVEIMIGSINDNIEYCSKESQLIERGTRPMSNDNKGRAEQVRWKHILDLAKANQIDDIDASVQIRHYGTLKHIAMDNFKKPEVLKETTGLWIHGPSGVGKSKYVFDNYPDHYIKSRNKWWQSYQMQPIVCLDDLGIEDAKWMGSFLKDWGGQYPFQAETKGASMIIRPSTFIVTSQYSIEQLWPDEETQEALKRRFKVIKMVKFF